MDDKQRNRVLGVLFVGVLMGALDIAIIGPAMPAIQAEFGLTPRQLPWLFSIYVLMQMISTPLWAKLSDFYGRRAIYVLDVALAAPHPAGVPARSRRCNASGVHGSRRRRGRSEPAEPGHGEQPPGHREERHRGGEHHRRRAELAVAVLLGHRGHDRHRGQGAGCLLYTSDAADE